MYIQITKNLQNDRKSLELRYIFETIEKNASPLKAQYYLMLKICQTFHDCIEKLLL
jgi:hypothetical protein